MFKKKHLLLLLGFTVLSFLAMGYHPGLEDDHVYLSAVQKDLNLALYPHDTQFFQVQLQATVFDKLVAALVRWTGCPLPYAELLLQLVTIFLILAACWRIAYHLFDHTEAAWGGVALVGAMLTLPVSGTALTLVDQYLHPRGMATACILFAVAEMLVGNLWATCGLLVAAFLVHPVMAAFGISFCLFLALAGRTTTIEKRTALAASLPLGWIFEPPNASWHQALATRRYYFLYRWTWYEWLGAIGPLLLFWLLERWSARTGQRRLQNFVRGLLAYGIFQQIVAMVMLGTPFLVRLTPLQPMRYLHLMYFFLVLVGGGLAGKYVLGSSRLRWLGFLALAYGAMFAGQRSLYAASVHLELPWTTPTNPWVQAFSWIRHNTPQDGYFALDPDYMKANGEDYHSFRALAERSALADAIKDAAVVTQVPDLGDLWTRQVRNQAGWKNFGLNDFERLKTDFGVTWVLLRYPRNAGLRCVWHNQSLQVCQIP